VNRGSWLVARLLLRLGCKFCVISGTSADPQEVYGFDKSDLELITAVNASEFVVALDKPVSFLDKHKKWCIRRHKHNRLRGDDGMIVSELIFHLRSSWMQM
jgi:hypothetical protein